MGQVSHKFTSITEICHHGYSCTLGDFFINNFLKHSLKDAPILFSRPILQGTPVRNTGCTGLSCAIFSFLKVFLFLQRHIYRVKKMHQVVFLLEVFRTRWQSYAKKYILHLFSFLRPKECNENHEVKDAPRYVSSMEHRPHSATCFSKVQEYTLYRIEHYLKHHYSKESSIIKMNLI